MYICVCKAVTDGQIRTAIDNGVCTRRQLVHCFGVGKDCCKCNKEVSELLKQRSEQNAIYSDGVIKHL
ncbi:MAG: (2Fe-2S)-binding protein [Methylococcales bacterium]|jgi:bacterioferritin-associated ferredoxin|nr:(2Fe-2S)-binding protein [Methylococcales bacterium]